MASSFSPLRYPGGKQILAHVIAQLVRLNDREGGVYAEPYAGGGGAALSLLFGEHVDRLMLNDADPSIYAFWNSVLNKTDRFLELLEKIPLTVDEWARQREFYLHPTKYSQFRLGFATFYLNRCNRSGIIGNGGIIGGREQTGKWKLDARFNRENLARRIQRIAMYRDRIEVFNLDAVVFLREHVSSLDGRRRIFAYLDPPYFIKGNQLYLNFYQPGDHVLLANYIKRESRFLWVASYDDVPQIRSLYAGLRQVRFSLGYSARKWRLGSEILIASPAVVLPKAWKTRIPNRHITAAEDARTSSVY